MYQNAAHLEHLAAFAITFTAGWHGGGARGRIRVD